MKVWYITLMKLKNKFFVIFFLFIFTSVSATEDFFDNARNLFDKKEYEKSKFLFQRNLVFNPKDAKSDFEKICISLCEKIASIEERLKNFDTSNES